MGRCLLWLKRITFILILMNGLINIKFRICHKINIYLFYEPWCNLPECCLVEKSQSITKPERNTHILTYVENGNKMQWEPITASAYPHSESLKRSSNDGNSDSSESEENVVLTPMTAVFFVAICCIMLVLMYYFYKYLGKETFGFVLVWLSEPAMPS